jgi:8-oxo-dGTP pyrophosphatase MutT (NUDIX family)
MDEKAYWTFVHSLPTCPGIIGRDRLLHSVVFVPFVFIDGKYQFLFEKRAKHIRQAGEVCFPGGAFEPDQDNSIRDTAIRETSEELGLGREKIHIDGRMDSLVAVMGHIIDIYVGRLHIGSLDEISPEPAEVEQVFTVPVGYFFAHKPEVYHVHLEIKPSYYDENGEEVVLLPSKELGLPERYHKPWGHPYHEIVVYKNTPHIIWGITARIIRQLTQYLRYDKNTDSIYDDK